uniref:Candidate secreted effector n=1 Tax=Meloidogyne incognita TaxID=6306 RepID=A0A914MV14_MELIC
MRERTLHGSVHIKAIHCKVFPSPISSAIIHPLKFSIREPVTHSYINFTPSR